MIHKPIHFLIFSFKVVRCRELNSNSENAPKISEQVDNAFQKILFFIEDVSAINNVQS